MDQNQWFNTGSPAPMNDRQAFEAGWTAAQRQMAYSPQMPQINERIFQQTPQQTPPPRPTYLPGRVVNSPDDIRASEIPMDGTVAVFPSSDYSHVILISILTPDGTTMLRSPMQIGWKCPQVQKCTLGRQLLHYVICGMMPTPT